MENTYHFSSNIRPYRDTLIVAADVASAKEQAKAYFGHDEVMYTVATLNDQPFLPVTEAVE
jgi:hypothetical protein